MDPTDGPDAPQALRDVLAGLGTRATATLGLPYHGELPEISIWQSEIAACFFGPDVKVINDVALAHFAAFAGGDGALILSGTGSMAWAQGPGARIARVALAICSATRDRPSGSGARRRPWPRVRSTGGCRIPALRRHYVGSSAWTRGN